MTSNPVAVLMAAVAAVVFAAVYYSILAGTAARFSAAWADQGRSPAVVLAFELVKSVVLALVIAGLVHAIGIADAAGALGLAVGLWIAFPISLLAGSVVHEKVAWQLAGIHAVDWFAKLVIIVLVVTIWA
jgi:Protein of unknown function (DUF1761)